MGTSLIKCSEEIVSLIMIRLCVFIGLCAVLASAQHYPYVASSSYQPVHYPRQQYSYYPQPPVYYPRQEYSYQPQPPVYYQPSYPRQGYRYAVYQPQPAPAYYPTSYEPRQGYSSEYRPRRPTYDQPRPSYKPTERPSYKPTERPSYKPTYKPSYKPIHRPSYEPSYQPSHEPSYRPSYQPRPSYEPRPYRPHHRQERFFFPFAGGFGNTYGGGFPFGGYMPLNFDLSEAQSTSIINTIEGIAGVEGGVEFEAEAEAGGEEEAEEGGEEEH